MKQVPITNYEGAEFLSDPCIMKGCIYHYGHDGKHEYEPFTEQDYRDQLDNKRVCSCGMCDTCDGWASVTTQDLLATVSEKSTSDAADAEDRFTMRQAAATLDARCGEGTAARYGFRDTSEAPDAWRVEAMAAKAERDALTNPIDRIAFDNRRATSMPLPLGLLILALEKRGP